MKRVADLADERRGYRATLSRPRHAGGYGLLPGGGLRRRLVVVVDSDIDPTDTNEVLWALSTRADMIDDVDVIKNCRSTSLDPMATATTGNITQQPHDHRRLPAISSSIDISSRRAQTQRRRKTSAPGQNYSRRMGTRQSPPRSQRRRQIWRRCHSVRTRSEHRRYALGMENAKLKACPSCGQYATRRSRRGVWDYLLGMIGFTLSVARYAIVASGRSCCLGKTPGIRGP